MNKITLYACIVLSVSLALLIRRVNVLSKKLEISKSNEIALREGVTYYKTADSLNVASMQLLKTTTSQLKQHNADLVKDIERLNLKLKRVESISTYPVTVTGKVESRLKDTIILSIPQKKFTFADGYLIQKGIVLNNDIIKAEYTYRDTIVAVVHRVPKKIWFIRWGTKAIRIEAYSKNPRASIVLPTYHALRRKD